MAEISASLVKELREKTGAGMMDCKRALDETKGDLEQAVDWLRKKGLSAAAKKAGRVAAEGLIAVAVSGKAGAIVEVNSETDFVARNETFQNFAKAVAQIALEKGGDLDKILAAPFPGSPRNVQDELTHMIATIGENMSLRRAGALSVDDGVVVAYVHNAAAPGLGRIGVLVALEGTGAKDKLETLGRNLAMHVAATNPVAVDREGVDASLLDRERDILAAQARESGKAEDIIAKMVEGRLRKFYEDSVLLEQVYVIDTETKVGKAIEAAAQEIGGTVNVAGFLRFALGEGVERKQQDFAAEVASQMKK
ncbi:MAG TPA: translation elongation factor Ts [Alphaproteobacteria bacterium]|jgi:elongation factor Ts|nr:translation elongation factor Ts [Alphaproteobacteria bacterium]